MATEDRVSKVRTQYQSDVLNMSYRRQSYYRKIAEQAIKGVVESHCPWHRFLALSASHATAYSAEVIVEDTLLARLVTLYEEAAYWYTRQQILSLFTTDYSKTELLALIPCLSKWRIDEARKHFT